MCAITGLVSLNSIDQNMFRAMNTAAAHRGPDGEGFYYSDNLALGHRRLAIIDLSSGGHQPMAKHGLYITYNGEIYNYKELKEELKNLGHTFQSESDTEVILSAYHEWGSECVKKFNGMWAFAIYNSQDKSLFCSRDRFGVKPFYYFQSASLFAFGSEIQQLLCHPQVPKKLNKKTVAKYLVSSVVDDSQETFFDGIFKLAPGHNLVINTQTLKSSISRYYDVCDNNTTWQASDFADLLKDSVRLRLRSDTPVGSCLSGGLDSSLIVSIASRLPTEGTFQTFTAVPFDGFRDESEYVKRLSQDLSIQTHFTTPTPDDFKDHLQKVIRLQEEPFLSSSIMMQYFVMKKAHETGLKVLLDGQGADEILMGYEKYFPSLLAEYFFSSPLKTARLALQMFRYNANVTPGFLAKVYLKAQLKTKVSAQSQQLLSGLQTPYAQDSTFVDQNTAAQKASQYRLSDLEQFNLPGLLRYEDKNSMHFGIETRLPYLDYRLVDVALKMPLTDLLTDGLGKAPLRQQFKDVLPSYISQRKSKFNFNAPAAALSGLPLDFAKQTKSFTEFFKPSLDIGALTGVQPWKVLNLCLWHEEFFG